MRFVIFSLAALLFFGGCSRPRTIPKDTLAEIFKESYLVNAYYGAHSHIATDTLDIYRPILKKHGYAYDDLQHTIGNFSKQKSAKLSDIVEQAINELKVELEHYDQRVALLDTIDARALRMFMREVFFEPQIAVRKVADTAALRITIPVELGKYRISYSYYIDSLEQNRNLRTTYTLIDSAGEQRVASSNWLTARRRNRLQTDVETTAADRELQVLLGGYGAQMKEPHMTIDSLRIEYFPLVAAARDSLVRRYINIHTYAPIIDTVAKDSSALYLHPLWHDPTGGDNH